MSYEIKAYGNARVLDDGTNVLHSTVVPPGEVWHLFIMPTGPLTGIINVVGMNVHVVEVDHCVGYYSYLRPDGFTDFAVTNTYPESVSFDWKVVSL